MSPKKIYGALPLLIGGSKGTVHADTRAYKSRPYHSVCGALPLLVIIALMVYFMLTAVSPVARAAVRPHRLPAPAASSAKVPNRLLIVRSMGVGQNAARELVKNAQTVQQLYYHILSLPPASRHQICPLYIIAEYQLTFFHNHTTISRFGVLQAGCPTVTLGASDIRTPDALFWSLFEQANDFGVRAPASYTTPATQAMRAL
jgi:hypothetical protein